MIRTGSWVIQTGSGVRATVHRLRSSPLITYERSVISTDGILLHEASEQFLTFPLPKGRKINFNLGPYERRRHRRTRCTSSEAINGCVGPTGRGGVIEVVVCIA